MAVASAGPYASVHLAPDRQPRQHPTTQFFTGRMPPQPAGDVSHKPGGRLPLLSAWPAVTPATLNTAATNFAAW